jgi:LPS-assembly lipoprotein
VRTELAAIEVKTPVDRVGYLVRDNLLSELNPAGVEVPSHYVLQISLARRTAALGIQLDNTATRYNLTLTAHFRLLDTGNQHVLYSSSVSRIASYNAIQDPFAQLSAALNAEERAAREISADIRTEIAIHFVRQSEAT